MEKELERDVYQYESLEEALMMSIKFSQLGYKQVALTLWPEMRPESAHQKLLDAVNPNKKQKLTVDQIILICNITDRHDALYYITDRLLFERPVKRNFEKESTEIANFMDDQFKALAKAYQDFRRMKEQQNEIEKVRDKTMKEVMERLEETGLIDE